MVRSFLSHILLRPVSVGMGACAVIIGGMFALTQLPLGLAPSREFPALSVHAYWRGASAENVEKTLTAPLEEIVSSLRAVRKVRSVSAEGRSRVSAEFDERAAMNLIRLELNEQISMLVQRLPHDVSQPVVEQYIPEDIEQLQGFLSYSLAGPIPRPALVRIASEEIVPRLMSVKGVARVTLDGEQQQEVRIELSQDKMAARGVAVTDVTSALETARPGSCRGTLRGPAGIEGINFAGEWLSVKELEDVPIQCQKRPFPVRLRDVAAITIRPAPARELLRINGRECIVLTIARDPLGNLPRTARDVRACVADLVPRLPPFVELVCESDQSRRMSDELQLLYRDALISLLLLWAVLVLFLGNNRLPLILISAVLLSLAATFLMLWLLHVPLHLLTLAGLALGAGRLLDDSIVMLENLRRWGGIKEGSDWIVEGASEVLQPIAASTAATVGALAPVLFLPAELQIYLFEFAVAVAVSLCMSLVVSLTVIPSATALPWSKGVGSRVRSEGRVAFFYRRLLQRAVRHRLVVLIIAVWMFGVPVWLLPVRIEDPSLLAALYNGTIGGPWYATIRPVVDVLFGGASFQFFRKVPQSEFFKQEGETFLTMQAAFPEGTDMSLVDAVARVFERTLLNAGAPRITARVFSGTLLLRVDFPDSVAATPLPQLLRGCLLRLVAQTGGAAVSVAGFGAGYSGGTDMQPAFAVRVFGYDYARVKQIAETLRERLQRNPRVIAADVDKSFGNWSKKEEIALVLDRKAARRFGLGGEDVTAAMRSRIGVVPGGTLVDVEGRYVPSVVTVQGSEGYSVQDLSSTMVSRENMAPVPLRSLIVAQKRTAPSEIVREDQQYVRCVSFEYKGPYRHAEAFLQSTLGEFSLPAGYRFDRTGGTTVSDRDRGALLLVAVAAVVVVFMITASFYESLVNPLIVMLSVPFACTGVFMAFVLSGTPFGRGGYVSVIFLAGIAVANAIVVVDFIMRKEKTGGRSVPTIVEASVCRLRPVLMTTLTTAGSLLPMLFGERSGTWYMLALGVFGGLLSSALLTLVVVPVAYAVAHRVKGGAG